MIVGIESAIILLLGVVCVLCLCNAFKWERIARDLYNAHEGSAGQWERSRERYEKAVGK
jgi:hypothetical protein